MSNCLKRSWQHEGDEKKTVGLSFDKKIPQLQLGFWLQQGVYFWFTTIRFISDLIASALGNASGGSESSEGKGTIEALVLLQLSNHMNGSFARAVPAYADRGPRSLRQGKEQDPVWVRENMVDFNRGQARPLFRCE